MKPRVAAFCLFGTVAVIGIFVLRRFTENREQRFIFIQKNSEQSGHSPEAVLVWWRTRTYSPVGRAEEVEAVIRAIKFSDTDAMNKVMEFEARAALRRFLVAYTSGQYDAYRAFCAPTVGFVSKKEITAFYQHQLRENGVLPANGGDWSEEAIRKHYFEQGLKPTKLGGRRRFEGFIIGVATEDSHLAITTAKALPATMVLADRVSVLRRTMGLNVRAHSYSRTPGPAEIAARDGRIHLLEILLTILPKQPHAPYELTIWHYWEPEQKIWIPESLIEHRSQAALMF